MKKLITKNIPVVYKTTGFYMMMYTGINFREKFGKIDGHWSPRVIAEMNDYQFKLAKGEGDLR